MKIIIYTDGGSRGNPGPAGIGVIFTDEKGKIIKEYPDYIGRATNNEAEYQAVIFALQKGKLLFGKKRVKEMEVEIRLDSELVAKQLNGKYKISDRRIQELFIKAWNLKVDFGRVIFKQIPRLENREADKLVNRALDLSADRHGMREGRRSGGLPGI